MGILKRMGGRTGLDTTRQHDRTEVARGSDRGSAVSRPLFRQEVFEFQQAGRQWGRVVPLQPLSTRLMVWSVFLVAAAVIVFLFFAQYARKEIALGYLAPAAGTARVFAPQSGIISAVYAQQGEMVEKGQPLLAITTAQFTGSGDDVNATILNTLDQHKQALIHEIADEVHRTQSEQQRLSAQVQEHESVLGQLDAQMAVQQARIVLLEKMVDAGAQLRVKGLVSEVDQRHREETLLEQRQAMISLSQQSTTRQGSVIRGPLQPGTTAASPKARNYNRYVTNFRRPSSGSRK